MWSLLGLTHYMKYVFITFVFFFSSCYQVWSFAIISTSAGFTSKCFNSTLRMVLKKSRWIASHCVFILKAHRQISKKRCFEKYCSYDQVCQVLTLYGTPWRSYLENLTIDGKLINKRVRLFIHQTMYREEKIVSTS